METNKTILPIQKCIEVALNLRVGITYKYCEMPEIQGFHSIFLHL